MIGFWKFMAHRCPAAAELGRSAAEGARVADADKPEVVRPADDVTCWLEKDSSVMLKAVTRFGDSVELVADDARAAARQARRTRRCTGRLLSSAFLLSHGSLRRR
jgi:hypothetical protein